MGYNIEISFNVLKNSSILKLLEEIRMKANEHECENFYQDYEFENKVQFQRRHCLIMIEFSQENVKNMIDFLNIIKKNNKLYIELIYNEDNHSILYASQYFMTQKMDKHAAKKFKSEKRERSYSEDEIDILNIFSKQT